MTLPFVGNSAAAEEASADTLFGVIFGTSSFTGATATTQNYTSSDKATYYIPNSLRSVTITGGASDTIFYGAFYNCAMLTSVTIGEDVKVIENYAFRNCTAITTVNFNATEVTSTPAYGSACFTGCTNIATVNFGNNVTIVPEGLFNNNDNITTVTIPANVTLIGKDAFENCNGIATLNFNAVDCDCNATGNSSSPFYGNGGTLVNFNIGENVTNIPKYLLASGVTGLTSVVIPASVTSIGVSAFYSCNSLADVYYKGTPSQMETLLENTGSSNTKFTNAAKHYYSAKRPNTLNAGRTDYDNSYWYYDDEVITLWTYAAEDSSVVTQATPSIGQNIDLSFQFALEGALAGAELTVTINGVERTMSASKENGDNTLYNYSLIGISPAMMGETITITADGVDEPLLTYSMAQYCHNQLDRIENGYFDSWGDDKKDSLKVLLEDMLYYGAASQIFTEHDTENLVYDMASQPAYTPVASSSMDMTVDKTSAGFEDGYRITGATVRFTSQNKLKFKFTAKGEFKVTLQKGDGDEVDATGSVTVEDGANGKYSVMTEGLNATEFDTAFTIRLYDARDGETLVMSITYSMYDYIYSKQNETDGEEHLTNMAILARATYLYGEAAKAFAEFSPSS